MRAASLREERSEVAIHLLTSFRGSPQSASLLRDDKHEFICRSDEPLFVCHREGADCGNRDAPPYFFPRVRFSALTIALIDASSMFVSMPAPYKVWPRSVLIWI